MRLRDNFMFEWNKIPLSVLSVKSLRFVFCVFLCCFMFTALDVVTCYAVDLKLEPSEFVIPYIELDAGDMCAEISMKIYDVTDLKEFHIDFGYDSNVVELIDGKIDQSFYLTSRGGTGNAFDKLIADAYTGTSVMYTYTFRIKNPGSTTISLTDVTLLDSTGATIPVNLHSCHLTALPFEEYMSEEYQNLSFLYNELELDFEALESEYLSLIEDFDELFSLNEELQDQLSEYETDFTDLSQRIQTLENNITALTETNEELVSQITNLEDEIEELQRSQIPGFPYLSIIIGILAIFMISRSKFSHMD